MYVNKVPDKELKRPHFLDLRTTKKYGSNYLHATEKPTVTCSKSAIETLQKVVKYV